MWATPTILGRVGAADNAPLAPVCATHVETNIESNSICSIFMARDGGLPSAQLSSCGGKGTRQYSGRLPTFRKKHETLGTGADVTLRVVILRKRSRPLEIGRASCRERVYVSVVDGSVKEI